MEVLRLDLASELRLRRWARLNYVSPDRRPASWHPIVLAEMSCRDEELAALADPTPTGARYVPLAPTPPTAPLPSAESGRNGRTRGATHRS